MDANRFDRWTRTLTGTSSRRTVLGLTAALGLIAAGFPGVGDAKKKPKATEPTPNEYHCAAVGTACKGSSDNCCSGICEGNKPKKGAPDTSKCAAHYVGSCSAGVDFCNGGSPTCGFLAYCWKTTGNASFCGGNTAGCVVCEKDTDCEADYGPGAACAVCANCADTGTACVTPYPKP